ncbi:MAG: RNA-binding domain-containing protein [Candidatus Hadarchaeum sp.]|uniref:RNA-binding domain-containing protein n=1 Tax=Candidatus Hadarchaeum sp. TaxID=2883567 RepID=UPI003D11A2FF
MEFPFSSVVISLHVHATEDEQKVLELLRSFLPASVEVRKSHLTGHHGNPISVLEARVGQKKELRELWRSIQMKMDEAAVSYLRKAVRERIDDSCFLYLRFDKQAACEGRLVLTELGESIHIKFKVISFPAKRDVAVARVMEFLEASRNHEV